jgi:hypothetical protein
MCRIEARAQVLDFDIIVNSDLMSEHTFIETTS